MMGDGLGGGAARLTVRFDRRRFLPSGMTSVFETAPMYTKVARAIAIDRVFEVTSLELR